MKIEWLITDVITVIGSPARAENDIFGAIFDIFWPSLDLVDFMVGEPLCGVEFPPSSALKPYSHL